jgi:hypothetical protein
MEEKAAKPRNMVSLPSSIMRAPYVFEKYEGVEGLTRDLAIWMAWNGAESARLNVKQFSKMFNYSDAYLFKKASPAQLEWLRVNNFEKEFKDVLGYALAKMSLELLNFPRKAAYVAKGEDGEWVEYQSFQFIYNLTTQTTRLGTNYHFKIHDLFLQCVKGEKDKLRYQEFDLNDYLELKSTNGKAWSAGRRAFLHLAWKSAAWELATAKDKHKHEKAQLEEILKVAGFNYAQQARTIHQVRLLLQDLCCFPDVMLTGEVNHNAESGTYEVTFEQIKQLETAL